MHDRTLQIIREAIRTRNYVMTLHAEEEMNEDDMNIFDVERVLLSGKIIEIQKDKKTAERKYIVEGDTISKEIAVVVSKINNDKKLVIITVYKI